MNILELGGTRIFSFGRYSAPEHSGKRFSNTNMSSGSQFLYRGRCAVLFTRSTGLSSRIRYLWMSGDKSYFLKAKLEENIAGLDVTKIVAEKGIIS